MSDTPDRLATLAERIRRCRLCLEAPAGRRLPHEPRSVFQVGRPRPVLLLCGQAPGTRAHAAGRPFCDPSGDRLRAWLGVSEAEFYDAERIAIVPMGFCFPGHDAKGGDLPPRPECRIAWHDRLMAAMPAVDLVLAIGATAQTYHLRRLGLGAHMRPTLGETVLDWRTIFDASAAPRVLVLPHPSWRNSGWLNRNPWFAADLLPVLRQEIHRRC